MYSYLKSNYMKDAMDYVSVVILSIGEAFSINDILIFKLRLNLLLLLFALLLVFNSFIFKEDVRKNIIELYAKEKKAVKYIGDITVLCFIIILFYFTYKATKL